jgi:hypothetical protein
MAWIKRNLFFFISLVVAVLLLAAAVVYDLQSLSHNTAARDRLTEVYATLQKQANEKYQPGNDKINNVQAAKDQEKQILDWIKKTGAYFKPIAPIPNSPEVTSEAFAAALRRTIDQLQHEAADASVELPPKYGFSFEEQRSTVKFAAGSLPPLSVQLGEVKALSEILFAARVNSLDGVQRVRVSDDDSAGPQSDYINDASTTNNLAVLTPYAVTFRSFSGELASVLAGFAASPHGFIVTGINVSSAGPSAPQAGAVYGAPLPPASVPGAGRGGLPTVLNEQLLRVTLEVKIVKLLPKK